MTRTRGNAKLRALGAANHAKGYRWEHEVIKWLRERGWEVVRYGTQARDKGDIHGIPEWTCELKNVATWDVDRYLAQAKAEAETSEKKFYMVLIKNRGKSTGEAYVLMPLEVWTQFIESNREESNTSHNPTGTTDAVQPGLSEGDQHRSRAASDGAAIPDRPAFCRTSLTSRRVRFRYELRRCGEWIAHRDTVHHAPY